ncbi:MAG: alpha/beta hydrolase [Alphaproteobacteria bacterium]|nr:alpha/beta hydrolase [Alphaproteobacteria bacterium]
MPITVSPLAQDGQESDITLLRRPAKGRGALGCWLALPREISADAPPLVAIHGIRRGARAQAALFGARAIALGRPVIAPLFGERIWPRYQQVVRNKRADLALLALMMELRLADIWRTRTFELVGYSGGGQFAHRFAMLYPQLVARLTVVSAGWFTFPDDAAFPYGLAARPGRTDDWGPRLAAGLNQFLRLPIQVCVGAHDDISDAFTRSTPEIDRQQGPDRMTRAKRWVSALREAAAARGIDPSVSFQVLPNSGHDFHDCIQHGGLDRLVLPDAEQSATPAAPMAGQPLQPGAAP